MEIHGDTRVDDYFWMRERDTPAVLDYLKQENVRTEEAMAPVAGLEKTLYREMRSRIKEDDASVPVFDQGYYYYWRYQAGQEYPLHCRRHGSLDAPEEVILDEKDMLIFRSPPPRCLPTSGFWPMPSTPLAVAFMTSTSRI
jgi:oligopeptidase B